MNDPIVIKYSEQLKKLGIEHVSMEHPEMVEVADIYHYYGVDSSSGLSTLVMKADGEYVAVIRRDDCRLDYEKVKQILGVKNLGIASDHEFEKLTGLPHGAAHLLNPVKVTLLDNKIFEKEYLMGGSGSLSVTIKYKTADLKKIPGMKIVDVASIKEKQKAIAGKRILSGITPSGDGSLHIGNYLGAVKQFIQMAKTNNCFLFVADLHALTTIQNQKQLQSNVETLILNELALLKGFLTKEEFNRLVFYRQSDIGSHGELQTILNNVTPLGLLKRAHAYKDKLAKDVMEDEINLGLFNYPILMAADILIYKPDLVPVGKDQKQHVEIARDIAEKFNHIYKKNIFKLPESYIPQEVASVLGIDGKRKMSKSLGNIISIFDSEEVIKKQVNSTFTDPMRAHATDPGHIEGNMVFGYLDYFGEQSRVEELKSLYKQGKVSDMEVKEYLFKSLMKYFAKARICYEELKNNPKMVKEILEKGAGEARNIAQNMMKQVREVVGLTNRYSIERSVPACAGRSSVERLDNKITIDEFARVEVRVGKVIEAINVEKSEKLIRLTVDFGPAPVGAGLRIIFTGVRTYGYKPEDFLNKQYLFVVNLEYRKMMGEESQGMILAVDGLELPFGEHGGAKPEFIEVNELPVGAKVR